MQRELFSRKREWEEATESKNAPGPFLSVTQTVCLSPHLGSGRER